MTTGRINQVTTEQHPDRGGLQQSTRARSSSGPISFLLAELMKALRSKRRLVFFVTPEVRLNRFRMFSNPTNSTPNTFPEGTSKCDS